MRLAFVGALAVLAAACASIEEDRRLSQIAETVEVNGRRWDFARDGDHLYVRLSGLAAHVDDLRFRRELVVAAEAHTRCRFFDAIWSEGLVRTWAVVGRLDCSAEP